MKRKMGFWLPVIPVILCFVLFETAFSAPKIMRVGTIMNIDHPHQKGMEKFAELVKQKTNGEIEVKIFPMSQLGSGTTQVQNVKMGSQESFIDSVGWYFELVREYALFATAFALNCEEVDRVLEGPIGDAINEEMIRRHGVRMLSTNYDRGPRHVLSSRPVLTVADVKGLKLRIPPGPHLLIPWKMLGASPTAIHIGELYLALQQKIVDGVEVPLDMIYTMKFHEVAKNLSLTSHMCDNAGLSVNEKWYKSLTQAQANVLLESAREAALLNNELIVETEVLYRKKMTAEGTKFHAVDVAAFREAGKEAPRQVEASGVWKTGFYDSVLDFLKRPK